MPQPSEAKLNRYRARAESYMKPGAFIIQPGTSSTSYGVTSEGADVRIATKYRLLAGLVLGSRAQMGQEQVYAEKLEGRTGWTVLVPYAQIGKVTRTCRMEVPGRENPMEIIEVIAGQDNCVQVRVLCAEKVRGKPTS